MTRKLPRRFWLEASLAGLGMVLLVLTMFTREWIELLTGLDPDGGNGAAEFAIVLALLAIAAVSAYFARRDYTRARLAAQS